MVGDERLHRILYEVSLMEHNTATILYAMHSYLVYPFMTNRPLNTKKKSLSSKSKNTILPLLLSSLTSDKGWRL